MLVFGCGLSGDAVRAVVTPRMRAPLVRPGVSGFGHVGECLVHVDPLRLLCGVFPGEKPVYGDVHELGVADEGLPVREGEVERGQEGVEVAGGIVAQGQEVEMRYDFHRLQQRRTLAPRTAGVDLVAQKFRHHRFFLQDMEIGQIVHRHQPAVSPDEIDHQAGRLTGVDLIARRAHAPGAR